MQQLTQKLGNGSMSVHDVPYPQLAKGFIIVKNHYSVISSGTEGSTVNTARKNLLAKAKERPQQVKQVIDTFKKQGPLQTYRAVMKKLDAYSPLGYSCAGEVIEVGDEVKNFKVGDLVACAGVGYANHAEIVSVPTNLCVKLDNESNLKDAAYNTLGAIAMQGVRQANLNLGETCVVIGLGLLGQLTSLILKASGVTVIGIDVSKDVIDFVVKNKVCDYSYIRSDLSLEEKINIVTEGIGADSVIISAGTNSLDPINFAGSISRKKGKVVILGAVPTGFDRDPHWYRKELSLEMSCSYGPGRYDFDYEEKGIDYPVSYVRWTQNRNMQAFQKLISTKRIEIGYLTTHEFDFEDATKAFDLIVNNTEPYVGVVLKYNTKLKHTKDKILISEKLNQSESKINISFIGAGSYAQGNLLPNIPRSKEIQKIGVLTNSGTTSKLVAEKFNFQFCTSSEKDIFNDKTNTIFIATRHDSHASYVLKALHCHKHVFVEKPLCLNESELDEIILAQQKVKTSLMVGYNRRFSPLSKKIKNKIGFGPISMIYRINAGSISSDHWIQDLKTGGGRIIGEVCHFIDYLTFLNGSLPRTVSAQAMADPKSLNDTVNILLQFENGSTGVICYYANGSKSLNKEYLELFCSGKTIILKDFKALEIYENGKRNKTKLLNQNKGQKEMLLSFTSGIIKDGKAPIKFDEIVSVTKTCFKVLESIKHSGQLIYI